MGGFGCFTYSTIATVLAVDSLIEIGISVDEKHAQTLYNRTVILIVCDMILL